MRSAETPTVPILRSMPYFDHLSRVEWGSESLAVNPFQILVWVGLAPVGTDQLSHAVARFPALLDTGCGTSFIISPAQLRRWSGVEWRTLALNPGIERKHSGIPIPHRRANVWLFPNQYGRRDEIDPILPPVLLELRDGIAVFGDGEQVGVTETKKLPALRLPLLGLRALTAANLTLTIDAQAQRVWLDRPA